VTAKATATVSRPRAGGVATSMQTGSKQEIRAATGRAGIIWVGFGLAQVGCRPEWATQPVGLAAAQRRLAS
jgi:hypothetical protein